MQNITLIQLIETIRGLLLTLAFAVKDIDNTDQAVCCTIEHQQQLFNVCFLGQNYGPNGILVFLVPADKIELDYFKVLSTNLNETFKFTFGDMISRILLSDEATASDDLNLYNYFNNLNNEQGIKLIRTQFDNFFSQLNQRLFITSLFNLYNSIHNKCMNTNLINNLQQKEQLSKLSNLNGFNFFIELRTKFLNKIPYFDLPFDIKCDLDMAMSDIEAQEFVDLVSLSFLFFFLLLKTWTLINFYHLN